MLHLIKATVRPAEDKAGPYVQLVLPSRDDNIRNHNLNLQAQGFEVLEVKVEPWYTEEVDPLYEADATPGFDEVINEQNSDTTETTGSSD